jgi:hypothetical protein
MFPCQKTLKTFDMEKLDIQRQKHLEIKQVAKTKKIADFKKQLQKEATDIYNAVITKCEEYYIKKGKFPESNSFVYDGYHTNKLLKYMSVEDINLFLKEILRSSVSFATYHYCNIENCIEGSLNKYKYTVTVVYPIIALEKVSQSVEVSL